MGKSKPDPASCQLEEVFGSHSRVLCNAETSGRSGRRDSEGGIEKSAGARWDWWGLPAELTAWQC